MADRSSTIVSAATTEREKAIEQALTRLNAVLVKARL